MLLMKFKCSEQLVFRAYENTICYLIMTEQKVGYGARMNDVVLRELLQNARLVEVCVVPLRGSKNGWLRISDSVPRIQSIPNGLLNKLRSNRGMRSTQDKTRLPCRIVGQNTGTFCCFESVRLSLTKYSVHQSTLGNRAVGSSDHKLITTGEPLA